MTAPHGATRRRKSLRVAMSLVVAIGLAAYALVVTGTAAHAAPTLLSQGKPTTASSVKSCS